MELNVQKKGNELFILATTCRSSRVNNYAQGKNPEKRVQSVSQTNPQRWRADRRLLRNEGRGDMEQGEREKQRQTDRDRESEAGTERE
jgi:hypothetical protein